MTAKYSIENLVLPPALRYTKNHLWVGTEDGESRFCIVGATEVISRRLAVTQEVQVPEAIVKARQGEIIGRIIGITAFGRQNVTIPIFCPVAGVVNPPNELYRRRFLRPAKPELLQTDPYGEGWLVGILANSRSEINDLMDAVAYRDHLVQLSEKNVSKLYQFSETELAASHSTRTPGIFICYRRADSSEWAEKLAQRIGRLLGSVGVHLDVASIPPGRDYRLAVEGFLEAVDVVIVLIGSEFFQLKDPAGRRRIDLPDDPVHVEIRTALEKGKLICPILTGNVNSLEVNDFPEPLRELAYRNWRRILSDSDLDEFVTSLRPDILRAAQAKPKGVDGQAVEGGWDFWRQADQDLARSWTDVTQKLIELGWLLEPRVGAGNFGHPDFPNYRLRFDGAIVWLDRRDRTVWGFERWLEKAGFPIGMGARVLSLPQRLKFAAVNPDSFLEAESGVQTH